LATGQSKVLDNRSCSISGTSFALDPIISGRVKGSIHGKYTTMSPEVYVSLSSEFLLSLATIAS